MYCNHRIKTVGIHKVNKLFNLQIRLTVSEVYVNVSHYVVIFPFAENDIQNNEHLSLFVSIATTSVGKSKKYSRSFLSEYCKLGHKKVKHLHKNLNSYFQLPSWPSGKVLNYCLDCRAALYQKYCIIVFCNSIKN